jgi:hypothetical protein
MVTAACHIHSEWSYDANWSLRDLATEFGRRGYRVLLTTEHDHGLSKRRFEKYRECCAKASSDELLIVPGLEYSDEDNLVHILVWGQLPFLGEGLSTGTLLKTVHSFGGIAVMAHPSRLAAWKGFDPQWTEHLLGIEIWNRKTDGWAPSADARTLLEDTGLLTFAGLDFHDRRQFFPLSMHLNVTGEVSEGSILEALRSGCTQVHAFGRPLRKILSPTVLLMLNAFELVRRTLSKASREFRRFRSGVRSDSVSRRANCSRFSQ